MMEPTVNTPDVYQLGNDYPQVATEFFNTTDASGNSTYRDGIYTEIADKLQTSGSDTAAQFEINGQNYAGEYWKNTNGFNKRTVLLDPFAPAETVTGASAQYSEGDVIDDGLGIDKKA